MLVTAQIATQLERAMIRRFIDWLRPDLAYERAKQETTQRIAGPGMTREELNRLSRRADIILPLLDLRLSPWQRAFQRLKVRWQLLKS